MNRFAIGVADAFLYAFGCKPTGKAKHEATPQPWQNHNHGFDDKIAYVPSPIYDTTPRKARKSV
jgi:hypothetical protein